MEKQFFVIYTARDAFAMPSPDRIDEAEGHRQGMIVWGDEARLRTGSTDPHLVIPAGPETWLKLSFLKDLFREYEKAIS